MNVEKSRGVTGETGEEMEFEDFIRVKDAKLSASELVEVEESENEEHLR